MNAIPYFLGISFIFLVMYIWSISLSNKTERLKREGICTIGMLNRVTMNSSYYTFMVGSIEKSGNNGVTINPIKIGDLFPVVYSSTKPQNGYIVNYKGDLTKYDYGDTICCEVCDEIKSKITYWDM